MDKACVSWNYCHYFTDRHYRGAVSVHRSEVVGEGVSTWAPGAMDGVPTHIYCTGEGTPTVVLVSGLADDWSDWGFILHNVAAETRTCAYDRAGLGWSGVTPAVRTSRNIAAELEATLNAAGQKGPYLLVGHSSGGLHIREYQAQHPNKVMGILFLDSSYPGQSMRLPPELRTADAKQRRQIRFLEWLSYFGVPRLAGFCTSQPNNYPLSSGKLRWLRESALVIRIWRTRPSVNLIALNQVRTKY
jgi:pimeloyl-ACP methyl ester carboxylesterase